MTIQTNSTSRALPDTGIGGVYEAIIGVDDAPTAIRYFKEFGFEITHEQKLTVSSAKDLYGVSSALTSYRLQNGSIDSHGLLRILHWEDPLGPGIGYAPPETIGHRMSVMMTEDIFRLNDIYEAARADGEQWLPTEPIADDLFELDSGKKTFFNRPTLVREQAVYGELFNHVFFQRYGYKIPGYGTINPQAPLRTSEFTHHDFIISATSIHEMSYMSTALGLIAEENPVLDGDWQLGPKTVFGMNPGDSHWYQGFVSPNNICGKLKFFVPTTLKTDRSHLQHVGQLGITLHSFTTDKLDFVHDLVEKHELQPTSILNNEFEERAFIFTGPGGCTWQIIEKKASQNQPETELKFELTTN